MFRSWDSSSNASLRWSCSLGLEFDNGNKRDWGVQQRSVLTTPVCLLLTWDSLGRSF